MQLNAICFMGIVVYVTAYTQFCCCVSSNLIWALKQNQLRRHFRYIGDAICHFCFLRVSSVDVQFMHHPIDSTRRTYAGVLRQSVLESVS